MKRLVAILLVSALTLSACASKMSSNTYKSGATGGKVVEGTIVSARAVEINDTNNLGDNGAGLLAGGAMGGVAGHGIGKGSGNDMATVGGVIVGALIGAAIQQELSRGEGMEYIVKVAGKNKGKKKKKTTKRDQRGDGVQDDIQDSISMDMETDMLSVVQTVDEGELPLRKGQKVYVIYSDDRPRVIAAE